jgi:hypothetical protein
MRNKIESENYEKKQIKIKNFIFVNETFGNICENNLAICKDWI